MARSRVPELHLPVAYAEHEQGVEAVIGYRLAGCFRQCQSRQVGKGRDAPRVEGLQSAQAVVVEVGGDYAGHGSS